MMILAMPMFGIVPMSSTQALPVSGETIPDRETNNTTPVEIGVPSSIPAFTKERQKSRILNAVMGRSPNGSSPEAIRAPPHVPPQAPPEPPSAPQRGSMQTASANGYWRATYFPDVGTARLDFLLSIGYLSSRRYLHLELSNENESFGRTLTIYVDGVQKHSTTIYGQTPEAIFDCSSWCSSSSSYLLTIEIRYGAYGRGWKLDNLWIDDGVVTFNAYHENADITAPWQASYQRLTDYAYFADDYIVVVPKMTASFASTGGYGRFVYLYLNGYYVGRKVAGDGSVLTWDLPSTVDLDLRNKIVKIEFRVYIPCSICTSEQWTLKDWNTEFIYSWRVLNIDSGLVFATNWTPSYDLRNDIIMGIKYFSMTMFQLFEGQVIYNNIDVKWNLNDYSCSDYSTCNLGDFNIYHGFNIPGHGSPRAFANGGKSYYSEYSPDYLGYTITGKWELVNKKHPGIDWFLFGHEFSHMAFGLKDQYWDRRFNNNCPNFIMAKSADSNGEITPNYSDRRHGVPDHCFTQARPPGHISDMDYILQNNPIFTELYYFEYGFENSPSNYFDYFIYTEFFIP